MGCLRPSLPGFPLLLLRCAFAEPETPSARTRGYVLERSRNCASETALNVLKVWMSDVCMYDVRQSDGVCTSPHVSPQPDGVTVRLHIWRRGKASRCQGVGVSSAVATGAVTYNLNSTTSGSFLMVFPEES
ncbi:Protein of unknown function [Pyronema omphalodes CBS 100304]|uniref:Secreted protein n=1 Tax=Pyronema omphalodes (strain CBS 100304) TaxID=1076935 RepID=U4LUH2_PYROM|nr:Protein of unknown function [Pyronema omphalodes CBS 100304]